MMELVPVILAAGRGTRMTSFTAHCPKPLLPIGGYPMIYYPVSMLERLGFGSAILIVRKKYADTVRATLNDMCCIKMKLDIISVPDQEDIGTAQMLKLSRPKIPASSDVLVMGCDFVSDINLNKLLHVFREKNASVTMLLTTKKDSPELPVPSAGGRAESVESSKQDMVFSYHQESNRLVSLMAYDDIPKEGIEYPAHLWIKFGNIRQRSDLTDCHVYVLKRWILDYLAIHKDCEKIKSIKYQLLPMIVNRQFPSRETLEKSQERWNKTVLEGITQKTAIINKDFDIFAFAELKYRERDKECYETVTDVLSAKSQLFDNGDCGGVVDGKDGRGLNLSSDMIRCFIYVQEEGFGERTNTGSAYCEANRQIYKLLPTLMPHRKGLVSSTATMAKSAQFGPDCCVGDGTKLGEKVSVKKSVVGKNCDIHDKVKITNSIIMDQVTLHENCTLMNCILFNNVCLAESCELKDCIVATGVKLSAYGKFVNEVVTIDPKK